MKKKHLLIITIDLKKPNGFRKGNNMFLLHVTQKGGGCDYTIGCGVSVKLLSATDTSAAFQEAKKLFLDEDICEYRPEEIEIAMIYEVIDSTKLPIEKWAKARKDFYDKEREAEELKAAEAKVAKLKQKLGKT